MKTLNTYGEVLIALGEGKTVTDKLGYSWRLNGQMITLYDEDVSSYIEEIDLPCTIKEEPEYLDEYIVVKTENADIPVLSVKTLYSGCNVSDGTKTGRKFIIENGIPVEVK